MSGLELINSIQKKVNILKRGNESDDDNGLQPVFVIQATICNDKEFVDKALTQGVDTCLQKPIKKENLAEVLLKHELIVFNANNPTDVKMA